jgi:8-oxo-dGTP pyrophosphatase MutT (NUDIX family)
MLEYYKRRERQFLSEWLPAPFVPQRDLTIQASGLCFTPEGKITLVSDGKGWVCPGGYPEDGESLEETLIREIAEEACARVIDYQYIGSIRTYELPPVPQGSSPLFYQARYWVRIENDAFNPLHEMTQRIDIPPEQFVESLRWNARQTARLMLDDALIVEMRKSPQL